MACKTRRYIPRMGRISCHCLHCFTRVDGGLKEHNLLDSLRHLILFGSVADPQQSKVDNQEQRVFLPTNLDWRMHVYNNRYTGSLLSVRTSSHSFAFFFSILQFLGSRWRSRRRLLTPTFHFQILESFFDVFNEHSGNLILELKAAVEDSSPRNPTVNVYKLLTDCSLDIICGSYSVFKIFLTMTYRRDIKCSSNNIPAP